MGLMLVAAVATGPAAAQQPDAPRGHIVVFTERQAATMDAGPSPALLTQLTVWLEANFNLPKRRRSTRGSSASAQHAWRRCVTAGSPRTDKHKSRLRPVARRRPSSARKSTRCTMTPSGLFTCTWAGARTPPLTSQCSCTSLSIICKMSPGIKFTCPQEREKDAYDAQRTWLERSGRTLEDEFEIDPMTVLVRTNCGF